MKLLRFNLCCLVLLGLVSCDRGSSPASNTVSAKSKTEVLPDYSKACREALDKRVVQDAMENCQMALRETQTQPDSLESAEAMEHMGEALILGGKIPQGISSFQNSLKLREKFPGEQESLTTANLQFKLGNLFSAQNNLSDAEFFLKQALSTREKINGTDAVEVALI